MVPRNEWGGRVDTGRVERFAPLAGVLFTVIFAVGFLTTGDTPDSDSPGAKVVEHYDDSGKIFFGVILLLLAGVVFMFFAGALRRHFAALRQEWLANVVFGGAVVFVAGLGIFLSSQVALVEAADANQVAAAEALNVIDNNNFGPAAIGLAIVLLGSAWHVLSTRSLPVWLGWIALLLGIFAVAGPLGFIAFLLFPLWVLAVSIVLFRAGTPAAATTTPYPSGSDG
jgi:hypothetical protein